MIKRSAASTISTGNNEPGRRHWERMNIDIKKAETCFADLLRKTVAGSDITITPEGMPIVRLVAVRKK
ncbi:MAG: hypothetical protein D3904_06830, partial [Candidatus Electrothrix sp. EH2]|nr:hypothetical protein [Candidatus Electrothrix sp. EH2]